MQITSMNPKYLDKSCISKEDLEEETQIRRKEAETDPKLQGKPQNVIDNIVLGKVSKTLNELCLLEQEYVDDSSLKVKDYLLTNNLKVLKYVRYAVGEGIIKPVNDFVAEVKKATTI
jgi:elongation factor Ts